MDDWVNSNISCCRSIEKKMAQITYVKEMALLISICRLYRLAQSPFFQLCRSLHSPSSYSISRTLRLLRNKYNISYCILFSCKYKIFYLSFTFFGPLLQCICDSISLKCILRRLHLHRGSFKPSNSNNISKCDLSYSLFHMKTFFNLLLRPWTHFWKALSWYWLDWTFDIHKTNCYLTRASFNIYLISLSPQCSWPRRGFYSYSENDL